MNMRLLRSASLALPAALCALSGCALIGRNVSVDPVAVSSEKPGNVAMFVAVSQNGAPVVGLDKQAFKVFENGVQLDSEQVKLTLLPTATSAARHIALLVDMSKTLNPTDKKSMTESLRAFIVKLRQREAVSLYAFDGTEKTHLIADYARDEHATQDDKDTSLDRLLSFSRRDSSSSLYTAVMDGAQKLSASLSAEGRPIQNGTVIVIALNPDLAGRVDDGKVRDYIRDSAHHYFLMTVGPWATATNVAFLGKNGDTRAASVNTMNTPLDNLVTAIDGDHSRDYLVSYCSPSRAGKRELRLEVTTKDAQGKLNVGSYETEIDASGFGPGCNPLLTPHFVVAKAKDKDVTRIATNSKPAAKPASTPAPENKDHNVKVSSATAEPKASATPIAEPPSGLGYE